MAERIQRGVVLPAGHTASSLLHDVLSEAVARYANALGAAALPADAAAFKREYGAALARFEAHRAASSHRVEIARLVLKRTQDALAFADPSGTRPLAEHLAGRPRDVPLQRRALGEAPGWLPQVPFEGKVHSGREILAVGERLEHERAISAAGHSALRWIVERIAADGGRLHLQGQRFALLGAGAELAPTRLLLQAGAEVLWVDKASPERTLAGVSDMGMGGALVQAETADDLLERPDVIAGAIERFAADGPVHLGLFAYASGASQEWRLGAAMNAIATALDPSLVRSIAMLVSPTTVAHVQDECARAAAARLRSPQLWQAALSRVGVLPAPAYHAACGERVALAAVSVQGVSYQAAQYVSKLVAAETYALRGVDLTASVPSPVMVSANVAGITRTRSLQHPLFEAAFIGAPRFGVRIFEPETTRALAALLMLHDLLNPAAAPMPERAAIDERSEAERVFARQIHGGVYSMPYALEPAIRLAALIGMGTRPAVLLRSLGLAGKRGSAPAEDPATRAAAE